MQSWLEQRGYLTNALAVLTRSTESPYKELGATIAAALAAMAPLRPTEQALRAAGYAKVPGDAAAQTKALFRCGGATVGFGEHGAITTLHARSAEPHEAVFRGASGEATVQDCAADYGKTTPCCDQPSAAGSSQVGAQYICTAAHPVCMGYVYDSHWGACGGAATPTMAPTPITPPVAPTGAWATAANPLGRFVYQSLSAEDFNAFDADYGDASCGSLSENPGCHNFNKPNVTSAKPQDIETSPTLVQIWTLLQEKEDSAAAGSCSFVVQGSIADAPRNDDAVTKYGSPQSIWTQFDVATHEGAQSVVSSSSGSTLPSLAIAVNVSLQLFDKRPTRIGEALWMTFAAPLSNFTSGWKMNGFRPEMNGGASVDPTHIVEHGATHLHGLGPFGALSYAGAEGTMSLTSLDAAIVSAGRVNGTLSAFPTPGDNSSATLETYVRDGWSFNLLNNIWNTSAYSVCVCVCVLLSRSLLLPHSCCPRYLLVHTDYPQWYPFSSDEKGLRFRFEVKIDAHQRAPFSAKPDVRYY